jgi:hypothetical protein
MDDFVKFYFLIYNIFFAATAKLNIHSRLVCLGLMGISIVHGPLLPVI